MRRVAGVAAALALVTLVACSKGGGPGQALAGTVTTVSSSTSTSTPARTSTTVTAAASLGPAAWHPRAAAPVAVQEVGSAVLDGKVWVVGGLTAAGASTKVQVYDPATDSWTAGPDLPVGLQHQAVVVYRNELVVVGGFLGGVNDIYGRPTDRVLALRAGTWVDLPKLRRPRGAEAAAVVGGILVVVGGRDATSLVGTTEVFDGSSWADRAPIPTPRDHLAAAADASSVYAVGGRYLSPGSTSEANERYDPARDAWQRLAPMPTARAGLGLTLFSGQLVAAGGENATDVFPQVEAYYPTADAWTPLAKLADPRHGLALNTVGSAVYALAGGSAAGVAPTATSEALVAT